MKKKFTPPLDEVDLRQRYNDASGFKERAFALIWKEFIRRNSYFLENLIPRGNTALGFASPPTKNEKRVAAEVFRWLGTNVGWSYMSEALQRCGCRITTDLPTVYPASVDHAVLLPKETFALLLRWEDFGSIHWLYTEEELNLNLPVNWKTTLKDFIRAETSSLGMLYGLTVSAQSTLACKERYRYANDAIVSTKPIEANF